MAFFQWMRHGSGLVSLALLLIMVVGLVTIRSETKRIEGITQRYYFDNNGKLSDYKPSHDFKSIARKLFYEVDPNFDILFGAQCFGALLENVKNYINKFPPICCEIEFFAPLCREDNTQVKEPEGGNKTRS